MDRRVEHFRTHIKQISRLLKKNEENFIKWNSSDPAPSFGFFRLSHVILTFKRRNIPSAYGSSNCADFRAYCKFQHNVRSKSLKDFFSSDDCSRTSLCFIGGGTWVTHLSACCVRSSTCARLLCEKNEEN